MKEFIENKMNDIFQDFKTELSYINELCILKDLRFNNGNLPNYSIPIIQQLYLLRYFPAYLVEYYDIYKRVIEDNFIDKYNVLSIGCGCGIDYYGLYFALKDKNESLVKNIRYTGVDIINWSYKEKLHGENIYYINDDITTWKELDSGGYNIIMFPKSIGEFSEQHFEKILCVFKNTQFTSDNIFLLSSVREQNDLIDRLRMGSIIDVFEEKHKFKCLDDKYSYIYYIQNVGLSKYFPQFYYPNSILQFITNLMKNCSTYVEACMKACEQNCATSLNKHPILKTGHIKYQIKRLKK